MQLLFLLHQLYQEFGPEPYQGIIIVLYHRGHYLYVQRVNRRIVRIFAAPAFLILGIVQTLFISGCVIIAAIVEIRNDPLKMAKLQGFLDSLRDPDVTVSPPQRSQD